MDHRIEHDLLGSLNIPADALHGIYTARAVENFPLSFRKINPALIHAYGAVKLACAQTNRELAGWEKAKADAIEAACSEMMDGRLDGHIIVDALQGGAGTSTNMNVNEVLSNRALQILGKNPGDYGIVNPLDDLNLHQSTNDTYPTALKVAAIQLLRLLQTEITALQEEFQRKEQQFAKIVKVGRTQLQDAVLITLGREMGAYAEAFTRDRWRIYKCEERLRVVNLGGTAIGTGIAAPRKFIFRVVETLKEITRLGLSRAENLVECTQNNDVFVEVSGILKACAVNIFKIASDLRLMASGPNAGFGEIRLPERQAGSSIMPGKVNPVIPEAATQAAIMVMSNDQAISQACALGNLELNAFMPLIADALLTNLDLLRNACALFRRWCVAGIEANEAQCRAHVENATAAVTALVESLGYEQAQEIVVIAKKEGKTIREVAIEKGRLTNEQFDLLISPESVSRLGSPSQENKS